MNKETILTYWKTSSIKQKLIALGILALLSIGVLGAMGEFSSEKKDGILSGIAETVGLKEKSNNSGDTVFNPANPPNGTLQLSKEYVYAGSRMLATEDYGLGGNNQARTNVALASNGGVASASSSYPNGNFPPSATINGDRKGLNWGNSGGWNDATDANFPDWLQINFSGTKLIDEINIFTIQDNFGNPVEPTENLIFSVYGITTFDVQYWNGSTWVTVPNGGITNNNKVWNKFTFSPIPTSSIRVFVNNALNNMSRIIEIEAFGVPSNTTVPPPLAPTSTPPPLPISGNFYQVIAKHSNKCADVSGISQNNGALIWQINCLGPQQTNQIWKFTQVGDAWEIRAAHSNKCMDVSGISQSNGAQIWQWDCHGGLNQQWQLIQVGDAWKIVSKNSNKVLDVTGGSGEMSDGAVLQQWEFLGAQQTNQLWKLNQVPAP